MVVPAAPSGRYCPIWPQGCGSQAGPVAMPESGLATKSIRTAPRPMPAGPSSSPRPSTVSEMAAIPAETAVAVSQYEPSKEPKPNCRMAVTVKPARTDRARAVSARVATAPRYASTRAAAEPRR